MQDRLQSPGIPENFGELMDTGMAPNVTLKVRPNVNVSATYMYTISGCLNKLLEIYHYILKFFMFNSVLM